MMDEMDVKELSSQDHEVLGVDFCSGYSDIYGKWNTGFNCPRVGNNKVVYCCGTVTYKYCCTKRDHHSSSGISQSVLLGSALGSMVVIIFVTLVSCLICRRCVPYRRHHASLNGGPLYALHCSSTTSGMANVYSFPCQSSIVTTPLDASHVLVGQPEHIYAVPMSSQRGINRHLMAGSIAVQCSTPTDPPPSYTEASASSSSANYTETTSPKSERNISASTEKEDSSVSNQQNVLLSSQTSKHNRNLMSGSIAMQCSISTDSPPLYTEASASSAAVNTIETSSPKPERNISASSEKEDCSVSNMQNVISSLQPTEHESTDS